MAGSTVIAFSTTRLAGTGVSDGTGVLDGIGVSVNVTGKFVGVQEGTRVNLGVTVGVRVYKAGFNVGGGNGLRLLFGSRKINAMYDRTQSKATRMITVRIFHTRALGLFGCGGPFTSETSLESMVHLSIQSRLWQQYLDIALLSAFAQPVLNGLNLQHPASVRLEWMLRIPLK